MHETTAGRGVSRWRGGGTIGSLEHASQVDADCWFWSYCILQYYLRHDWFSNTPLKWLLVLISFVGSTALVIKTTEHFTSEVDRTGVYIATLWSDRKWFIFVCIALKWPISVCMTITTIPDEHLRLFWVKIVSLSIWIGTSPVVYQILQSKPEIHQAFKYNCEEW